MTDGRTRERSWIDRLVEGTARQLARRTSRRTLLARVGTALVGGAMMPLLPVLRSIVRAEAAWLDVVLAGDGPREEHEAFVAQHHLERVPYVLSPTLGISYQVGKLPYAVLLDASGVILAKGLVNTREHLESLFEARDRAVASLQDFLRRAERGMGVAQS